MANEKNNNLQKYLEMQRKAEEEEARERAAEAARIAKEKADREAAAARARAAKEAEEKRARDAAAAEAARIAREKQAKAKKRLNVIFVLTLFVVAGLWALQLFSIHSHALGAIRILAIAAFVFAIIVKFYLIIQCDKVKNSEFIIFVAFLLIILQCCLCWRVFAPAIHVDEESGVEYQFNANNEKLTIVGVKDGTEIVDLSDTELLRKSEKVVLKKKFLRGTDTVSFTLNFDGDVIIRKGALKKRDTVKNIDIEAANVLVEINAINKFKGESISIYASEDMELTTQSFLNASLNDVKLGCGNIMSVGKRAFVETKIKNITISETVSLQLAKNTFKNCDIETLTFKNAEVMAGKGSNSNEMVSVFGKSAPKKLRIDGGSLAFYSDPTKTVVLASDASLIACRYSATISAFAIEIVDFDTVILARDYSGTAENYSSSGLLGGNKHQMALGRVIYIPSTVRSIPANLLGNEGNVPVVYYEGTEAMWNSLFVGEGNGNYYSVNVNFNATHEEWNP